MMVAVTFAEENAPEAVMKVGGKQNESTDENTTPRRAVSPLTRLINIFKRFEDAMAATAYTDAGEFDMARKVLQQGANARKRILLGTDKQEIDLKFIEYALTLCQRVGARLEILHLVTNTTKKREKINQAQTAATPKQIQTLLGDMGIDYHPVETKVSLENELIHAVEKRRDIMLVLIGGKKGGKKADHSKNKLAMAGISGKLRCPLVIYDEAPQAL